MDEFKLTAAEVAEATGYTAQNIYILARSDMPQEMARKGGEWGDGWRFAEKAIEWVGEKPDIQARNAEIREKWAKGSNSRDIMIEYYLCDRQVRRIIKGVKREWGK